MITNSHSWDISLKITNLDISKSSRLIIPSSSVKGFLRSRLAQLGKIELFPDLVKFSHDLFGTPSSIGRLYISDLCLESTQIEYPFHLLTFSRWKTANAQSDQSVESQALADATFRGTLRLLNGGTYPTVLTYCFLSEALSNARVGSGFSRRSDSIATCSMYRSDSIVLLNPIEEIFRKAGAEIIKQISLAPELIYSLEWRDLERIMALIFEEIGYKVKLTQASQDGGKDLVLFCLSGHSMVTKPVQYYVEIKHWQISDKVGKRAVNKLVNVSVRDGVTGAVFISTSGYVNNIKKDTFDRLVPKLGDLSTIRTLCNYYLASRSNKIFTTKTLEEIINIT